MILPMFVHLNILGMRVLESEHTCQFYPCYGGDCHFVLARYVLENVYFGPRKSLNFINSKEGNPEISLSLHLMWFVLLI